ncbi:MAG: biotin--[acetyl-CoA-carboxylase] ligase [Anaerolineaceae bacterium]|nr:biotin--[acetyl-CoA-carboxylase] ligase [Anaerolineaceae bacterium]
MTHLHELTVAGFHINYLPETGSTNDDCLRAAEAGAPEYSVFVADHQTQGRGRGGRTWNSTPKSSLAFSVLLYPTPEKTRYAGRFSALGALSLIRALENLEGIESFIKWPNDVLLNYKKIAGVLVESLWDGDQLKAIVLGIGINIKEESIPDVKRIIYPATSIQTETSRIISRSVLLSEILKQIMELRPVFPTNEFVKLWNNHLAFKGKEAYFHSDDGRLLRYQIQYVDEDGCLIVRNHLGKIQKVSSGELAA